MFVAALFITARVETTQISITKEWLNRMWYSYTTEYLATTEVPTHTTTRMNFKKHYVK